MGFTWPGCAGRPRALRAAPCLSGLAAGRELMSTVTMIAVTSRAAAVHALATAFPCTVAALRRAGRAARYAEAALAATVLVSAAPTEPPACWAVFTTAETIPASPGQRGRPQDPSHVKPLVANPNPLTREDPVNAEVLGGRRAPTATGSLAVAAFKNEPGQIPVPSVCDGRLSPRSSSTSVRHGPGSSGPGRQTRRSTWSPAALPGRPAAAAGCTARSSPPPPAGR